ncbi:hypothetical protein CR203_12160 [Salipaludibacillus neizhouensis]|uniref:DUF2264 domain-containing protein n=1 Tax=Salipaludibacillus neizhouensis TaxID=885475 RepID=A0A3A9KHU1_9BACI|nr:DUF2264 domain-containing protein [Salipaludibacillus neizhouensis]RKL67255.1 hypothetical protein CR203_12160 [Salipaludibacillus neizhouensis]
MSVLQNNDDRKFWLDSMLKIASPVLLHLNNRTLKQEMPVEMQEGTSRENFSHLEALSRLLVGMAPWLERVSEDEEEEILRLKYAELARAAVDAGTDPTSPDYMNFSDDFQPIVDTAFLANAILRAPTELWKKLDDRVKKNVITAIKATRTRKPIFSNWLLFSAIIEAFLYKVGEKSWDPMRIDYAIKQFDQWYLGDGIYSDGPEYHHDYYNSFVIHPMLVDLIETVGEEYREWTVLKESIIKRSQRYAVIQERTISPEGTFPPVGRSLAYRFGVFQSLAQHALRKDLPKELPPAQVRSALTEVIKRTLSAPGTFVESGWLRVGFSGHQPGIGEGYISTGSLYLCTAAFLPLGLPSSDSFWSDPPMEWTSKRAWSGKEFPIDYSL